MLILFMEIQNNNPLNYNKYLNNNTIKNYTEKRKIAACSNYL